MQDNKKKYFEVELDVNTIEKDVLCADNSNQYGGDANEDWGFDPFTE